MRPRRSHPNGVAFKLLCGYSSAGEACADYPWLDDIFSGVLSLRSEHDTATRSLSRKMLFAVLCRCPVISTSELEGFMGCRYTARTIERYAAAARVAATAIEAHARRESFAVAPERSVVEARRQIDLEFAAALIEAEQRCLAVRQNCIPLACPSTELSVARRQTLAALAALVE